MISTDRLQKLRAEPLTKRLYEVGVSESLIEAVVDSGYFLKSWMSLGPEPNSTVSDPFYGNKFLSSSFRFEDFVAYIRNERMPQPAPPLRRYKVKSVDEIRQVLSESRRSRYIEEGSLTFRGQPREHTVHRRIPNPIRRDAAGLEISIMPGLYRQTSEFYSLSKNHTEIRSFAQFAEEFEPDVGDRVADPDYCYDLGRTEQHYATQTAGLDIAFSSSSAMFFATHKFQLDDEGRALYQPIPRGEHCGVIYMFRFGSPSVRQTEYLIRDFDFFRTHRPERILRQNCGLPQFSPYERNIALTDVDGVIELDADFEAVGGVTPQFMFPNTVEDPFYRKLLELKDRYPQELENVVVYQWARSASLHPLT